MAVLSLPEYKTIETSCIEYVHPWNNSCTTATFELLVFAFFQSLKTYTTVYLVCKIFFFPIFHNSKQV